MGLHYTLFGMLAQRIFAISDISAAHHEKRVTRLVLLISRLRHCEISEEQAKLVMKLTTEGQSSLLLVFVFSVTDCFVVVPPPRNDVRGWATEHPEQQSKIVMSGPK